MNRLLEILDGSKYKPRPIQKHYFNHLWSQLSKTKIHAMSGPPGVGKSYIARTIQRTFPGAALITPSNLLVDQYAETYKELNMVKGFDWYESEGHYHQSRKKALNGEPSIFNPLSFYYYNLRNNLTAPQVVIIDEAHALGEMLLLTIGKSLSLTYYGLPKDLDEAGFLQWLDDRIKKLNPIYQNKNVRSSAGRMLVGQYESLKILHDYLQTNLHQVKIFYEEKKDNKRRLKQYLTIQPLMIPADLIKTIFGDARIIMLSGSLTSFHIEELFPKDYKSVDFCNYEPLAPPENRPILHTPVKYGNRTNPEILAKYIRAIYRGENSPNTLVHVSYAMSKLLAPHLKDLKPITHVKDDKQEKLQVFKDKGGLLLAAGMAEGVDLPGDLCKLIIIPRILFPNLGDDAVKKRMALPNGQTWYDVSTMMTTVQQIGRGVRSAADTCKTYILDPMFPRLYSKTSKYLTKGFCDSIKWDGK